MRVEPLADTPLTSHTFATSLQSIEIAKHLHKNKHWYSECASKLFSIQIVCLFVLPSGSLKHMPPPKHIFSNTYTSTTHRNQLFGSRCVLEIDSTYISLHVRYLHTFLVYLRLVGMQLFRFYGPAVFVHVFRLFVCIVVVAALKSLLELYACVCRSIETFCFGSSHDSNRILYR